MGQVGKLDSAGLGCHHLFQGHHPTYTLSQHAWVVLVFQCCLTLSGMWLEVIVERLATTAPSLLVSDLTLKVNEWYGVKSHDCHVTLSHFR